MRMVPDERLRGGGSKRVHPCDPDAGPDPDRNPREPQRPRLGPAAGAGSAPHTRRDSDECSAGGPSWSHSTGSSAVSIVDPAAPATADTDKIELESPVKVRQLVEAGVEKRSSDATSPNKGDSNEHDEQDQDVEDTKHGRSKRARTAPPSPEPAPALAPGALPEQASRTAAGHSAPADPPASSDAVSPICWHL